MAALADFIKRYRRRLSPVAFAVGFVVNSLTLTRIDRLLDNLILLGYLVLLAGSIVLQHLLAEGVNVRPWAKRYGQWYPLATQFMFGELFSAYVIFYFQSAATTKTFLFVGALTVLLIANEFFEKRLGGLPIQMALFYLASFSFLVFFLPVVTKILSPWMFPIAGLISVGLVAGVLVTLVRCCPLETRPRATRAAVTVLAVFGAMNLLNYLNWIPPVPLSVRLGGAFHQIERQGDRYIARYEKPPWYNVLRRSDARFHWSAGEPVYCFASVFAPSGVKTSIVYHWQRYSQSSDEWESADRIAYEINGGRDDGYRGYTVKRNIAPGRWRIDIETPDGRVMKRVAVEVVSLGETGYELVERSL